MRVEEAVMKLLETFGSWPDPPTAVHTQLYTHADTFQTHTGVQQPLIQCLVLLLGKNLGSPSFNVHLFLFQRFPDYA